MNPKITQDKGEQVKAFRKAARELGCDDDEGRFQTALRTIAKAKPKPQTPAKGRRQESKA